MKHRITLGSLLITLLAACNFRVVPTPTATPTATPPPPARLSVVYLDGSTLYGWQDGDSAPRPLADNALAPIEIAPDGQHVAFARGDNGQPQTLWVVGTNDTNSAVQQQLVEISDLPAQRSASVRIGQVGWLDEATVYFNTVQAYTWGDQPDNNLYRVRIGTATEPASSSPALILPRGAGGQFAISPDRQHVAVVYPGQYDNERGRIHVIDPLGEQVSAAFEFTAVSTASEVPFYPPLSWTADSGGVRVPIPSRDLVFDQAAAPPVPLWLLPVTGDPRIAGYVPASTSVAANGLPRWSDLTSTMLYFQRSATADALYDLFLADADGGNPQHYADGSVEILDARWIPGAGRFVYMRGTSLMLGQRGMNPQVLADRVQSWILVGSDVVYTTTAAGMLELRALHVDSPGTPVLIATLAEPPVADAAFSR